MYSNHAPCYSLSKECSKDMYHVGATGGHPRACKARPYRTNFVFPHLCAIPHLGFSLRWGFSTR